MIYAAIQRDPIDPGQVLGRIVTHEDGAALLFVGVVRDHADGRQVDGMRYDAYEEMASEVLREIADEASSRLGTWSAANTSSPTWRGRWRVWCSRTWAVSLR